MYESHGEEDIEGECSLSTYGLFTVYAVFISTGVAALVCSAASIRSAFDGSNLDSPWPGYLVTSSVFIAVPEYSAFATTSYEKKSIAL